MAQAIILAGGKGTRLWPLTAFKPKPLMDVGGRPLLQRQIEWLAGYNFNRIIVTVEHDNMNSFYDLNLNNYGNVVIAYVKEQNPLGTAGAVKNCEDYIQDDYFLVINGDIFTDTNLTKITQMPKLQEKEFTGHIIGSIEIDTGNPYGSLKLSNDKVEGFEEKGKSNINSGIYYLNKKIFNYITKDKYTMFETDVFPLLVKNGELYYVKLDYQYWYDIGTIERYIEANKYMATLKI